MFDFDCDHCGTPRKRSHLGSTYLQHWGYLTMATNETSVASYKAPVRPQ